MVSLWNDADAGQLNNDPLKLRVYTSRLLGKEEDLVLHGGGNTSVKIKKTNIFGEEEDILYVKGSGWDLATIEAPGFAPVRLDALLKLAELDQLSDLEMVRNQRMAMIDPSAPNPSVEAILHALIPYRFVDHSHADAVVTISNTPNGRERIEELYGKNMLIVPYVMPGFILAKEIYNMTRGLDWDTIDGMILMNHGVFTFHEDARQSYERMIDIVSQAEDYLAREGAGLVAGQATRPINTLQLASLRRAVSEVWGKPVLARQDDSPATVAFSNLPDIAEIANRGPLTPDHIIRTKRTPLILAADDHSAALRDFQAAYSSYFDEYNKGETKLDQAPRWAIWPGCGAVSFGPAVKNLKIIEDISRHTAKAIYQAEQLGGWKALPLDDLFEMEYWSLEQAKLKRAKTAPSMQGRVAIVTGAAGGIGKACAERLVQEGASVAVIDINPDITSIFPQREVLGIQCDVTDTSALEEAVKRTIAHFGGLDMLVANAGIFPKSATIAEMDRDVWQKSLDINVTSHQRMMQICVPYLELGFDPAIVIIGSKNVPAPGPGASAYSVAKAGLTQLGRIAAMELGGKGIRVNMIHPNAVYDTGIWTDEVLQLRAKHYGLTVEEYKTNNVLRVEVSSKDVAELAALMLGRAFSKITGAQVPIDGGNNRVI